MDKKQKIEELKNKLQAKKNEFAAVGAKQNALKVFLNSGYGALTNIWFRFFDLRLATSITIMGQVVIRGAANYVEKKIPLIDNSYIDTDSMFLNCSKIIEKKFGTIDCNKEDGLKFIKAMNAKLVEPAINEFFEKLTLYCNAKQNTLKMQNELVGDKGLFLGKKKYAINMLQKDKTVYLDNPKLKITGIEVVRTSTPQIIREELKKAIKVFFEDSNREALFEFTNEMKKKFDTMEFIEVAFPRSVSSMANYTIDSKGVPIAVRAAHVYNQALKDNNLLDKYRQIYPGDKVKFAYIKAPNIIGSNVIACPDDVMPDEFSKKFEIDYDLQFTKTFEAPLEKIFIAMDWSTNQAVTSLEDFFS